MAQHPVTSWARVQVLQNTFYNICEDAYSRFLGLDEALKTYKGDSEERVDLERIGLELGVKTIVFAGMCLEAAIYDYASIQLGDKFVKKHFEKLDLLSKWIIIPKFVCGKQIRVVIAERRYGNIVNL